MKLSWLKQLTQIPARPTPIHWVTTAIVASTGLFTMGVVVLPAGMTKFTGLQPLVAQQSLPDLEQITQMPRSLTFAGDQDTPLCLAPGQASSSAQPTPSALVTAATWLASPRHAATTVWNSISPEVYARLHPAPWPTIHPRSRQARVPVIMYHDVLPEKQVFFDVTIAELEADFEFIRAQGLTPISLDQLMTHLQTGLPLPDRPILLTFDDGYVGHYTHVYPLLQEYGYPAVFSVFTDKVDGKIVGRSTLSWDQLKEMAADPLVTIAAHSVTHPRDLREFAAADLEFELEESKRRLEAQLGEPIRYFTYPEGKHDKRVMKAVVAAGYKAAIAMDDQDEGFAGESPNLLAIDRFGQSQLEAIADQAWGGAPAPAWGTAFNFQADIQLEEQDMGGVPMMLVTGGRPITLHANSRYQVKDIVAGTGAEGAVDGGFFSMRYLDSNVMIGPVLSQSTGEFVPGNPSENPFLTDRPLVLISPTEVKFVPFDADRHNTLAGIQAELPDVTDAFVAAAWLVKAGEGQAAEAFGTLFDFDAYRHRAFWGIRETGEPVVGATGDRIDSVGLGQRLADLGLREAVMLDSGASTSVVYQGESLMQYEPRPVPHAVALVPKNWGGFWCHDAMYTEGSPIQPRLEPAENQY